MTERLEHNRSGSRTGRRRIPISRAARARDAGTFPVLPPTTGPADVEPTILGFPAEFADEDDGAPRTDSGADLEVAPPSPALTVLRRVDPVGAAALVLAGVAANVSLLLSWAPGPGPTGLSMVKRGVETLRSGSGAVQEALWQPPLVVVCGGLLILLGLLLLVPARAHRLVGVLALTVALAAAAAVAVLLLDTGLADDRLGPGMWCAVAVPVLGVLGSLKAMLTVPIVTLAADPSASPDHAADVGP